jgi:hypothetical protein
VSTTLSVNSAAPTSSAVVIIYLLYIILGAVAKPSTFGPSGLLPSMMSILMIISHHLSLGPLIVLWLSSAFSLLRYAIS